MHIPGRPLPTTFEYVEAIALRDPQRLALVQDLQSWTYQAFYLDLLRVVRVLHDLGVKRGDRIAVGTSGLQAGLVLLVAAENLGAATASFLHEGDSDAQALFGHVEWVFSEQPQKVPERVRNIVLDAEFLGRVEAVDLADPEPVPRMALAWHEAQRISRTSGSSGKSKFMLLSRQAQEWWVRAGAENGGYRPESRLLLAGPLVMNVIFARASACLRMGAAVFDLSRTGLGTQDITHVLALPALLEDILRTLPRGYAPRRRIDVHAVGGFVSPQLRERAAQVFGGRIASRYGANEVCGICDDLDANGVGIVSPGVDLRIVDGAGKELPRGQLGIVEVRTPGMAEGYMDDAKGTKAAFRDGWFHSGDWGTLVGPRVLRLAGRIDDLVNIGGIKIPATKVEAQVRELVQPKECVVLGVNLDGGHTQLGIALVTDGGTAREDMRTRIAQGLQLGASMGARVLFVEQLPRLGNGKIDRVALHRMFETPPEGSA